MESLIKLMKESCDGATSALNQKWISECCAIINDNRERIEDWMPHDTVSSFIIHIVFALIGKIVIFTSLKNTQLV